MTAAAIMEVATSSHSWYAAVPLSGLSRIAPPLSRAADHMMPEHGLARDNILN
jgi:hypothetical protein